jgi:hypothetical protein
MGSSQAQAQITTLVLEADTIVPWNLHTKEQGFGRFIYGLTGPFVFASAEL